MGEVANGIIMKNDVLEWINWETWHEVTFYVSNCLETSILVF